MTIGDIAKLAGVSRATVSGVLNNSPTVSKKTHERVMAIIKEHNYRPNEVARALALNKTGILGLLVKDVSNPLYSKLALGVEEICDENEYNLIISNSHVDWERQVKTINLLKRRRVDGLIIFPLQKGHDPVQIKDLQKDKFPFVLLAELPGIEADLVRVDDESGSYQATSHLLKLGRKHIAYISGPDLALASERRLKGYKKALSHYDVPFDEKMIRKGGWRLDDGYNAGLELLSCDFQCPDAVFCYNDSVAIGLIRAFTERGKRVPEDVSVIGFDDTGVASYLETSLTTVAQPAKEIGRKATELLLKRIKNRNKTVKPHKILINTHLMVRETCGANLKGSVKAQVPID